MATLNINMLTHALSATEACNPIMLQLIVQKDYDQDVLFPKKVLQDQRNTGI